MRRAVAGSRMMRWRGLLAGAGAIALWALPAADARAAEPHVDEAARLVEIGRYGEAEAELAQAPRGGPRDLVEATLALRIGQFERARGKAKAAQTDKDPKRAAEVIVAEALHSEGKLSEAIAMLRSIEAEPEARRARLLLGEYLIEAGKRSEARAPLMTLINDYNSDAINGRDPEGLSYVGRALHHLRHEKESNKAFKEATRAGANKRVETLLWRGELFLDKYNPGDAESTLAEAEKLAPTDPRVILFRARSLLESQMDFAGADKAISEALAKNPNLAQAYALRANIALRDLDIEGADAAIQKGLAINPSDLDLLSTQAATRFLADDLPGFAKLEKSVLERNPEFSRFYQIVGESAEWEHRYEEIVRLMEKAVAIDPKDAKAEAQLGLNLIRAGREDEGLKALTRAWEKDAFNVRVFNTLNLFEKTIPVNYVTVDGQTFRIRYPKDEKAMLERYVPKLLEEAWGSMVKRYGFTPTMPISIELYAEDQDFSVRTSGLPHVGIQGVCFGKTLAMLSPAAGPFNWGTILWHELGHVFAIQLSKNHVPRWFTEGLSEYETIIVRPEWQREEDVPLYSALKKGKLPKSARFNQAFTHVDSTEDVVMAYFAASQMVVFIVERFGWDKVPPMLTAWGRGDRSPEVIQKNLGVSPEELDRAFAEWLTPRLAKFDGRYVPDLSAPPLPEARAAVDKDEKSVRAWVELAIAFAQEGQDEEAGTAIERALALDPKNADALYVAADLALGQEGKSEEERGKAARARLSTMIELGHDGVGVRMKEAEISLALDDHGGAEKAFEAAFAIDPRSAEPMRRLAAMHHADHYGLGELGALRRYAALEQHDRAAWERLLSLLVERGRWDEALKVGEGALFVDIHNPEVHRLYARALANSGRPVSAISEYKSALIAGAKPADAERIYLEMAKGYEKLGHPKLAATARSYAKRVSERVGPTPSEDDPEGD